MGDEEKSKKNEDYFNELLEEKQLPYEVEFISGNAGNKIQVVDICDTGWESYTESYDTKKDILNGKFIELDSYLASAEGAVIKDSLPQNVWDTYKVNGKQYTVLSVRYTPFESVYIWNTELAEKYDIHPETWDGNIWEYEDSLLKVSEGEKGQVITIANLLGYLDAQNGLTNVLGLYYPIVVRETDEEIKAELLYDTKEYKNCLEKIRGLYEKGIFVPDEELTQEINKEVFLEINTQFTGEAAYESYGLEAFWKRHDWKKIGEERLWELSCGACEIGITTESKQPEKVFAFLCQLYKDIELTNALMWGREETDYILEGNRVSGVNQELIFGECVGNALSGYAGAGEDENKKDIYRERYEGATISKINGFYFTGKDCQKELEAISRISMEFDMRNPQNAEAILYKQDEIIQRYKEAGIDKVIEEWNRQYQQWKEGLQ